MKVLCVGMMVCDIILTPVPGNILSVDSAPIDRPVFSCGGDALNVAVGLRKLGLDVTVCGRIAQDPSGDFIRKVCTDFGIGQKGLVADSERSTATSYVLVDTQGERHFLSDRKIFDRLCVEDVPDELIREADIIYFGSAMAFDQMNRGGLEQLFRKAKDMEKITVLDAAVTDAAAPEGWLPVISPVLRYTDYFLPSISEAREITGLDSPEAIAELFCDSGLKALGIKLGGKGCFITDFRQSRYVKPLQGLQVADTTGAGDSFVAGFIRGLVQGWDAFTCVAFGNCVAGKNVEKLGSTGGVPDFEEACICLHNVYTTQ